MGVRIGAQKREHVARPVGEVRGYRALNEAEHRRRGVMSAARAWALVCVFCLYRETDPVVRKKGPGEMCT